MYYISSNSSATKGLKINVKALDPATGKESGLVTLRIGNDIHLQDSVLYVGTALPLLIWTDTALKVLNVNFIGYEHITSFNIRRDNDEQVERVLVHAPPAAGAQAHFLVHYESNTSHWAEVYHVDLSSRSIDKAYDLPLSRGVGAFSASAQGASVFFTRITESGINLFSSLQKNDLAYWPIRNNSPGILAEPRVVSLAVSEVLPKEPSKYAVRSALVFSTGDWELIRNGDHIWSRPESLAGITAAAFLDPLDERGLADELAMESHSSLPKAYAHRVRRHLRALQNFPVWTKSVLSRLRRSFVGVQVPETEQRTLDGFGLRKLVIVATENGRLIALDAGKHGRVIWNIHLVDLSPGQKWEVMSIDSEGDIALIRGNQGEMWRVQSSNGAVLYHQPRGMRDDSKTAISVLDASGEKFLVHVNDNGSLGYYPQSNIRQGTIVVTCGNQGALHGWSLTPDQDPLMAWEFAPAPGEVITKVVVRSTHDPIASIGKALGDRNVLYKYVNPNILLIVTANPETSRVTINILDSASGHILHAATHSNVDTTYSTEAIVSENWVAYSLLADVLNPFEDSLESGRPNPRGYQLIISELYKSQYPNVRGPLDSILNVSSIYPNTITNGFAINLPHVQTQAYSIPGPISHLSITSTLQGITPRSLLCFLPSLNALISIPRTVLDPRRPVGRDPSPAEMEEGLFKHNPVLEFEPKWIFSHKREILSLRRIITSPSLLESTSLVFSYGMIDIFGTRLAPIGGFDMLGKGFSKLQLVGTVFALAIGTGVVAPMVSIFATCPCLSCMQILIKFIGSKEANRQHMESVTQSFGQPVLIFHERSRHLLLCLWVVAASSLSYRYAIRFQHYSRGSVRFWVIHMNFIIQK